MNRFNNLRFVGGEKFRGVCVVVCWELGSGKRKKKKNESKGRSVGKMYECGRSSEVEVNPC